MIIDPKRYACESHDPIILGSIQREVPWAPILGPPTCQALQITQTTWLFKKIIDNVINALIFVILFINYISFD